VSRVALITSYPFPDTAAPANRVRALAEALAADCDFQLSLVCPGPDPTAAHESEPAIGYDVIFEPEDAYKRTNLLLRAWREITHTLRLMRTARRLEPAVVVVTLPSMFLLWACWYFPRGRVVVDVRDLVWDYLAANRGIKRIIGHVLTALANMSLRRAALVSVTNDAARLRLQSARVASFVVHNGISASRFERMSSLAEQGPPAGITTVTYIGNLGLAQELDTLVLALGDLPGVNVVIVGGGTDAPRLQELVRQKNYLNIVFTGPRPWSELLNYYSAAHVLYGQIGQAFATAVPSKLFEYLTTGRRVVFGTPPGIARRILGEFDGVRVVDPRDQDGLRTAVQSIMQSGDFAPIVANRERVRNKYLREPQAREFVRLVKQCFQPRPRA
jgi:glycosyltransferase involved in cell wall biosynthesis